MAASSRVSFAEMAARSNRVANWLRAQGVQRGDRVLLMLPNRVELWEIMLAGIKLGAVMVPTSMLAMPADLADRMQRGAHPPRHRAVVRSRQVRRRWTATPPASRSAARPTAGSTSPTARAPTPPSRRTA